MKIEAWIDSKLSGKIRDKVALDENKKPVILGKEILLSVDFKPVNKMVNGKEVPDYIIKHEHCLDLDDFKSKFKSAVENGSDGQDILFKMKSKSESENMGLTKALDKMKADGVFD